ncbi:MAG: flap endonuclease-1 [Candidatus Marsarchaeota archaeon]|jgi:flap endonuclease-1|nr:flap endonuclease-1 [Candidatus Marsarchaeota archaeon]
MAVEIGKLVSEVKERIELDELSGKTIAIDAYNTIYQFLSIIRQPDGTPLTDSKGRVTSHLSGLFHRSMNLLEARIQPVFVFDGIPSALKQRALEARMHRRDEARRHWSEALEKGMVEEARTYAMASTRIDRDIVDSSKELLGMMGIPWIQAPGEGEAQSARMTRDGIVYASASQDYDSFLLGATTVIRNLAISGRRKLPGRNVYVNVSIERACTGDLLKKLGIDQRMLIMLGALVGTDFNTGVDRVGPMTALKIVREHKTQDGVSSYVKQKYGTDIRDELGSVIGIFENPETAAMTAEKLESMIEDAKPDRAGLTRFMCVEHGFSEERISKHVDRLVEMRNGPSQKGINKWL